MKAVVIEWGKLEKANINTELWEFYIVFVFLQDGSAADPDLSGILSVCQRHPIHCHWHADTSVRPPQGQKAQQHSWFSLFKILVSKPK